MYILMVSFTALAYTNRIAPLVVKASACKTADLGFDSRSCRVSLSASSHISDSSGYFARRLSL